MEIPGLSQLDDAIGDALDRRMKGHHRSRLERIGWQDALDAAGEEQPWAHGGMQPRDGNAIELLVDGVAAMGSIAREIRAATRVVEIAGWIVSGDFSLPVGEDDDSTTWMPLRQLLAETAQRGVEVRVLVWGGVPLLRGTDATRTSIEQLARELTAGTRVRCALDSSTKAAHCNHEKVVIVDERVAFVGGIDMTDIRGRRCDTPAHVPRGEIGWHDVSTRLEGPIVTDVLRHVRERWQQVTGEQLAVVPGDIAPAGQVRLQLLRTIPERTYEAWPRGDFGILEAYLRALRSSERLIYIENQFIWSPEVVDVLVEKLASPPSPDFRLLLVLPAKPVTGGDDNRGQLAELLGADATNRHILACTLHSVGEAPGGHIVGDDVSEAMPEPTYVHAKVCVVDDRWVTVGSANLNDHSLFNDSEVNVAACDPAFARSVREQLWAEHLQLPLGDVVGNDPLRMIEEQWRPIAAEQAKRWNDGAVPTHRLSLLEVSSKHSRRLLGPLENLLLDG